MIEAVFNGIHLITVFSSQAIFLFSVWWYVQIIAPKLLIKKHSDGSNVKKDTQVYARGMVILRAMLWTIIDVLMAHGLSPTLDKDNLSAYSRNVECIYKAMTTHWDHLTPKQQNDACKAYNGLLKNLTAPMKAVQPTSIIKKMLTSSRSIQPSHC